MDDHSSVDSTGSLHHLKYDIDNFCSHHRDIEAGIVRSNMIKQALLELGDIDSDDEDPQLMICFDEFGFEFDMLKNVTPGTYMKVFYRVQTDGISEIFPNLYRHIMKKITEVMEEDITNIE
mmetsp:Transcript_36249/g.55688  ORF Transcript_36249/g.55688 Transcript_36249/m.55688 type:complete len:121 (+) Transcript_36249:373-735(+)